MRKLYFVLMIALLACSANAEIAQKVLKFEKTMISEERYEAASAFDVDNDGKLDIVSGGFWYPGPDFNEKIKICTIKPEGEGKLAYYDDFSTWPMDVNGDGYLDFITGGFWGLTLYWRENPQGQRTEWTTHDIEKVGNIERCCFFDMDHDGIAEAVPNAGGNIIAFKLITDENGKGTGKFEKHVIKMGECGHGLGAGDITGNGNLDFIVPGAWLEAPDGDPFKGEYIYHKEPAFTEFWAFSDPTPVMDINGDGLNDVIIGNGHGYGLFWYEQKKDENGKISFISHTIDADRSQYHDIQIEDLDNDGQLEIISGKRWKAHNGGDPGTDDPLFVMYFKNDGKGNFTSHTIDSGPEGKASGVGIYFWIADVDENGWKDIIAPGKEGLYLFKNMGLETVTR